MKHSEDYIENRLKWRANKNGLPKKSSFLFDDIDSREKSKFKEILKSSEVGKPVLLFVGENNTWTIIGTKRIASGTESSFDLIEHSEIEEYTVGEDPMGFFSEPDEEQEFSKREQHQMIMRERGGRMLTLHGPKGEELYAMFNIILMLDRMITTNHNKT